MSASTRRGSTYRYLLGDSTPEARRLRAQARLWDPVSLALFDRLGIRRGWRILEIGPGQGSLHLELRRRVKGPVDAVEPSAEFAANLKKLCAKDGHGEGTLWQGFLSDAKLPAGEYDLIFARWVFLFLPDALGHLKQLVRALKPGGRLVLQDYQRETLAMIPRPEGWEAFLAADLAFFASQGGDASAGAKLPGLLRRVGLTVEDLTPHIKVGRPGSPVWEWLSTYFLAVLDRYAEFPPFDRTQARRLRQQWLAAAREKTSVMIAPTVMDVVGRKPLRTGRG